MCGHDSNGLALRLLCARTCIFVLNLRVAVCGKSLQAPTETRTFVEVLWSFSISAHA
jgi:hypothetical protein